MSVGLAPRRVLAHSLGVLSQVEVRILGNLLKMWSVSGTSTLGLLVSLSAAKFEHRGPRQCAQASLVTRVESLPGPSQPSAAARL